MITKKIDSLTMSELWAQNTDGHLPILLEIYNPDIKWDGEDGLKDLEQDNMYLRVINDSNSVMYKGKRYIPCSFSFKAPQEDGTKVGGANITISGIDSRVQQLLGHIRVVSDVTVVSAFVKNNETKYYFREISHWKFGMETASANRTTVTFNFIPNSTFGLNVPRDFMDKNQVNSIAEEAL